MTLLPEFTFRPLHGLALILPLFAARYGIILLRNPSALRRVNVTPPVDERAPWAAPLYMLSEALLIIYPFFLTIKLGTSWFVAGLPFLVIGLALVALSALEFARGKVPLVGGIYRYSRNPMYVGYFFYFIGIGLMTASWLYLFLACAEQIGLYWLIRGEERWCLTEYGESYRRYASSVRRYAGRRAL